jgi:transcriptional regulator with XRE-family HTH domain
MCCSTRALRFAPFTTAETICGLTFNSRAMDEAVNPRWRRRVFLCIVSGSIKQAVIGCVFPVSAGTFQLQPYRYGNMRKASTGKMPTISGNEADREICRRIRDLAAKRQMTQADLAREADVSFRQVHSVVKKLDARLRDKTIGKFARALGTTVEYLRDGKASPDVLCVREPSAVYEVKPRGETPLYELFRLVAEQTGVNEQELIDFVLSKMKQKGERP